MNRPCSSTSTDAAEESVDLPEVISSKRQKPKECSVCGKPATGFHYEVAACNGCKTFFKRQWTDPKEYFCNNKRDCFDLTIRVEPLKCRFCRYEKCKKVGMNPGVLQKDRQPVLKKMKEENDAETGQEVTTKQALRLLKQDDDTRLKMLEMLVYLEFKLEDFRLSAYNPVWQEYPSIEKLLQTSSKFIEAAKSGPMPARPLTPEREFPFPPVGATVRYRPDRKMWFFYNLMTTIEYAKTFSFFYKLSMQDRIVLLRYVSLACMNLHVSYFSMAKRFDTIIQPDGRVPKPRNESHYALTVMSVAPLIRYNVQKVEYVLLKAICLCNPAVPNLSETARNVLSQERKRYADTLFEHCLRTSGPDHFASLIGLLDLLERQQKMQKDLHLLFVAPYSAKQPDKDRIFLIDEIMDS